jgi:hypothetical protein
MMTVTRLSTACRRASSSATATDPSSSTAPVRTVRRAEPPRPTLDRIPSPCTLQCPQFRQMNEYQPPRGLPARSRAKPGRGIDERRRPARHRRRTRAAICTVSPAGRTTRTAKLTAAHHGCTVRITRLTTRNC